MAITRKKIHIIILASVTVLALVCYWQFTIIHHLPNKLVSVNGVSGWEQNRSRNASDYIFPDRITTLVNSNRTCSAAYPPLVLVIIISSTDHFASRAVIRRTWAHSIEEKFNISVAFLVGVSGNKSVNGDSNNAAIMRSQNWPINVIHPIRKVETWTSAERDESNEFGDIIVEDFVDTYNNLTLKSLMMLKWVKNNCPNVRYVMKLDDDVYINAKNLAVFVNNLLQTDSRGILCGELYCSEKPRRDPLSKWYIPPYMYAEEFYPDYLTGHCYLMSMEIALKIYDEAFRIPIIHLEDVFLTGICAKRRGITPLEHYTFKGFSGDKASMKKCTAEDEYLVVHSSHISAEKMDAVHTFISNCYNNKTSFVKEEIRKQIFRRCHQT